MSAAGSLPSTHSHLVVVLQLPMVCELLQKALETGSGEWLELKMPEAAPVALQSLFHVLCSSNLRQADRMMTPNVKGLHFCYSCEAHSFCLIVQWWSGLCQWLE